jgi:hypothetical protein
MTTTVKTSGKEGVAWPEVIQSAEGKPNGARFYRCALQVNPYEYLSRNKKATAFKDEATYNRAIVDSCLAAGVEVIAVTDHYRVRSGEALRAAARKAGINVLGGFEASTKDGVHLRESSRSFQEGACARHASPPTAVVAVVLLRFVRRSCCSFPAGSRPSGSLRIVGDGSGAKRDITIICDRTLRGVHERRA